MKTQVIPVFSASVLVDNVEVPIFDSLAEAVEKLTEATCLDLVNTQHGTNIRNAARAKATKPLTAAEIETRVWDKLFSDPAYTDRFRLAGQDAQARAALITEIKDQVVKDHEMALAKRAAEAKGKAETGAGGEE
jgi:hypothetical protein